MARTYTDYINKIALTVPDQFIDVKTGTVHSVSQKIQDQIEYHSNNDTLMHLVFSALNGYLHPKVVHGGTEEILIELMEIKKMLQHGYSPQNHSKLAPPLYNRSTGSIELDLKEVEDVLEAFGG